MNESTIAFGAMCVVYGVATIPMRVLKPHWFRKLAPMKERFGRAGLVMHWVSYTVLPMVFGMVLIARGLDGGSIVGR